MRVFHLVHTSDYDGTEVTEGIFSDIISAMNESQRLSWARKLIIREYVLGVTGRGRVAAEWEYVPKYDEPKWELVFEVD